MVYAGGAIVISKLTAGGVPAVGTRATQGACPLAAFVFFFLWDCLVERGWGGVQSWYLVLREGPRWGGVTARLCLMERKRARRGTTKVLRKRVPKALGRANVKRTTGIERRLHNVPFSTLFYDSLGHYGSATRVLGMPRTLRPRCATLLHRQS